MISRRICVLRGLPCLVLGGALVGAPDAHAIIIRDDVPDSAYVVEDADYPAVVTLFPPDDCAATLFHQSHLLTVAHCAVDLTAGDTLEIADMQILVAEVTLHPMWTDGDNYDIAIVRLADPVTSVEPLPLYRGADEMDATVTLVGRGTTATGLEGESGGDSDGMLRRATNVVTSVDELLFEVVFDSPSGGTATDLEGVGASGDSGGPVFLDVDGVPHVAGLNAFGDAPNGVGIGQYGSTDYQTRVSAFAGWVDETVADSEASGETDGSGSSGPGGAGSGSGGGDGGPGGGLAGTDSGVDQMGTESGCACRHGEDPGGSWAVLLLGVVAVRRRRCV